MLALFQAIYLHVLRVLTLKHDGIGLPKKKDSTFFMLFAVSVTVAILTHLPEFSILGFCLLFLVYLGSFYIFHVTAFSLYLCLWIGLDSIRFVLDSVLPEKVVLIDVVCLIWTCIATVVCSKKLYERLRKEANLTEFKDN